MSISMNANLKGKYRRGARYKGCGINGTPNGGDAYLNKHSRRHKVADKRRLPVQTPFEMVMRNGKCRMRPVAA